MIVMPIVREIFLLQHSTLPVSCCCFGLVPLRWLKLITFFGLNVRFVALNPLWNDSVIYELSIWKSYISN